MSFVLDNSIAMRWCFETEAHPYADGILRMIAAGTTAFVPTLWFYEASAVIARAQIKGSLAASKAEEILVELQSLRIVADEEGAARAFTDVHRLAVAYRLTSYDAAYLEKLPCDETCRSRRWTPISFAPPNALVFSWLKSPDTVEFVARCIGAGIGAATIEERV